MFLFWRENIVHGLMIILRPVDVMIWELLLSVCRLELAFTVDTFVAAELIDFSQSIIILMQKHIRETSWLCRLWTALP